MSQILGLASKWEKQINLHVFYVHLTNLQYEGKCSWTKVQIINIKRSFSL